MPRRVRRRHGDESTRVKKGGDGWRQYIETGGEGKEVRWEVGNDSGRVPRLIYGLPTVLIGATEVNTVMRPARDATGGGLGG